MVTSPDGRGRSNQFCSADWLAGILVILAVLILHSFIDFFSTPERRYDDFASISTSRQPSDRIAIIAIDDQSIADIGRWPWPRDVQAKLINQLATGKAKKIVNTTLFFEPQTDRGTVYIRSELYPLGVMLCQMLAVAHPFRGDLTAEPMCKIAIKSAPNVPIIHAELPEKLANIVALFFSRKPETRYLNGDQFAADFRDVMAHLSSVTITADVAKLPSIQNDVAITAINYDTKAVQSPSS